MFDYLKMFSPQLIKLGLEQLLGKRKLLLENSLYKLMISTVEVVVNPSVKEL